MSHSNLLDRTRSILAIIDVQEAFRPVIPRCELLAARIVDLVRGCSLLNVPIVVTEQYPKGIGHTAAEIRNALGHNVPVIEKTTFSAWASEGFREQLRSDVRDQVILCGIETHICVGQTAQELIENGFTVHVVEDAVASRVEADKETGLKRLFGLGAVPTSVEMALFELARDSRDPVFKDIQSIAKCRADIASVERAVGT